LYFLKTKFFDEGLEEDGKKFDKFDEELGW